MDDKQNLRKLIDTWYDDWFAMDRLYYAWARRRGIKGGPWASPWGEAVREADR